MAVVLTPQQRGEGAGTSLEALRDGIDIFNVPFVLGKLAPAVTICISSYLPAPRTANCCSYSRAQASTEDEDEFS